MSGNGGGAFGFGGRARLIGALDRIRESYWFLPGTMSLIAVVAAFATGPIDRALDPVMPGWLGIGRDIDADSARAMLNVIAGSTVGVAGVTFSILIAAVAFTSGQFGPRVVGNLMRNRTNQVALGVYLAAFLFCLLSLRLVGLERVPTITLWVATLLAIASVAMLIRFFHQAPESIRLSSIIATSGRTLIGLVERRFPLPEDTDETRPDADDPTRGGDPAPVDATADGYLRIVDYSGLTDVAARHDVVIRIDRRPGDFVGRGRPMAWVSPLSNATDECLNAILRGFDIGESRSPAQDMNIAAQQLCDIAARGLSSGINDPRTAMSCLDWLGAALARAARGRSLPAEIRDEDGAVRLLVVPHDLAEFADFTFGALRPYFERDRIAALHMMAALGTLVIETADPQGRDVFLEHARRLAAGAVRALGHEADRAAVAERLAVIELLAIEETSREEAMGRYRWL